MPKTSLNRLFVSIVVLSFLAIGLFIISIFVVILPSFERTIMEGKKEMISELTNSVCSLVDEYQVEARNDLIPVDSAKALAIKRVRRIRYGEELKDYFWIIDKEPRMIMHPYRPELIGTELDHYKDPHGKLLFVESVKTVAENGEGFVDYMWQWKDDETRIVPKLSFVKEYMPWGWIVGTGIYLEDVRIEINLLKRRLLRIGILFCLVLCTILAFIIRQSLSIEKRRRRVEKELRLSREKYRSLVEASTEGTLMMVEHKFTFSNIRFKALSGYDPSEVKELDFEKLFNLKLDIVENEFNDPKKSISLETTLNCKDGSSKEVVVSTSRITYSGQTGYILIIKEVSTLMQYEKDSKQLSGELQTSLMLMNQSLKTFAQEATKCDAGISIREAAQIMARKQRNALLVQQENKIIGLINNNDLVRRVLAKDLDPDEKVIQIMTSPVIMLSENAALSEALLSMKKESISHIATLDSGQRVSGMIGFEDIVKTRQNMVGYLLSEIFMAEEVDQLSRLYKRLPVLVKAMIDSGSNTENITRIVTSVADAIHERLIGLTMEELGPAPCKFAFMVMGSLGRKEQTLATDQDNAIVIEDGPGITSKEVKNYFLAFGEKMNKDLSAVGYALCPGEIMAGNPAWNQELKTWKGYFSEWIQNSNPKDILDAAIFFDFRFIFGEKSLVEELRYHVNKVSESKSVFFYHMAQSVMKMKPPLNFFGNIVKSDPTSEDLYLDIKKILLPVTSFIRLFSIREKLTATHSPERAEQLHQKKIIDRPVFEDLTQAFDYLTYLRIKGQALKIARNEIPDNKVNYNQLSRIEEVTLKKLFTDIVGLQTRLGGEFNVVD